jgi:hypothetical protein
MKNSSKVTCPAVVAAFVATAGTAVAITYIVRRYVAKRPKAIVDRCDRAVGELERQLVCAPANC